MGCFIKLTSETGVSTFVNMDLIPEFRIRKDANETVLGSSLFITDEDVTKVMELPEDIIRKMEEQRDRDLSAALKVR